MAGDLWWLVAAMVIGTVVGVAYYLRWAALAFRRPASDSETGRALVSANAGRVTATAGAAVVVPLILTVALSVAPSWALGLIERL